MKIRRNSLKQIRALIAQADEAFIQNHKSPNPSQVLETPVDVEAAVEDWIRWTRQGNGKVFHLESAVRFRHGRRLECDILILDYHGARDITFVIPKGDEVRV